MILENLFYYACDRLFVYQVLATLTTFSVLKVALYINTRRKRYQIFKHYGIPGPEPRLLDGSLHKFLGHKACYLIDQQHRDKYGKVFGFYIGDEPILVATDLNILKTVFLERMSAFKERQRFFIDTPITTSILFAPYNRWKLMRKVMAPTFNSYNMRGSSSTQFIEGSVKLMINYIESKLDEKTKCANIDIHNLMQSAALYMISNLAVDLPGVEVKENERNVASLNSFLSNVDKGIVIQAIRFPFLRHVLTFFANHFEYSATMKSIHQGLSARIDQSAKGMKEGQKAAHKTGQLIDILIQLYREGRMTRDEVMGNADALLIAGYDTTSTTLAYIFWVLGKHPEVQERLRDDLMARGIDSQYLEQVINETMRLYPTVITFTERLATETIVLDSLTVPKGTRVSFNAWLMHRDPELWPEPEKFDPERFRPGAVIHPCAYAPFGLGERKCIGYYLAKLEMKMITCDVILRYRLKTKAPEKLELITYAESLTKPSEKVMIELEKR